MKIELKNEFPIILLLSVGLALLIVADRGGTGRVVLGLPFVMFFPGYTLIAALLPARDDLSCLERVSLSFGLSIAVVPLLGLILNYTPWGLRLYPILMTLLAFTILLSVGAIYRRSTLSLEDRFIISLNMTTIKWGKLSRLDKILSVALAAIIIFSAGSLYHIVTTPKDAERFTEFYILGPGGRADGYPVDMKAGEKKEVILGVVNHEYRPVSYTAEVRVNGYVKARVGPLALNHEDKKEESVGFIVYDPHEELKVEFLLFKDGEVDPYRSLHLWVNVSE